MTKKKDARARGSSRADGVTVREVGRRSFVVDFIVDTPDGRYRFRRKSPFSTIGESREWGKQHKRAILDRGKAEVEAPRADPTTPRDFAFWARRYLEDAESPARRRGPNKPSTVRSKRIMIEKHLIPAFGRKRITDIDDDDVERYLIEKAKTQAYTTLELHASKLIGVLRFAKRKGCPAERALQVPEVGIRRKKGHKLPPTLSEEQTDRLLEHFEDTAEPWQLAFVALLFRGGLRAGEALALRWSDASFASETIIIQRTLSEGVVRPETKGGRVRTIPMHWQVRDALLRLEQASGWVFPSDDKRRQGEPRSYDGTRTSIPPRWDELGFVGEDGQPIRWKSHIGRHSVGRHGAERGWPLKMLQELFGHADLVTTQIYMHWARAASAPLLQQLGRRRLRVVKAAD